MSDHQESAAAAVAATTAAFAANSDPQRREHSGAASAASDTTAEALKTLDFTVHTSIRYHARRRAWFEGLQKTSQVVSALAATAAVAALLASLREVAPLVAVWASGLAGVAGTVSLVFGFSDRSRRHEDLYRRFSDLAADLIRDPHPSDQQVREWIARRLLIEKDEPPSLDVLNVICHNKEAEARDLPEHERWKVRWWQQLAAQLISLPPFTFRRLKSLPTATSRVMVSRLDEQVEYRSP